MVSKTGICTIITLGYYWLTTKEQKSGRQKKELYRTKSLGLSKVYKIILSKCEKPFSGTNVDSRYNCHKLI